MPPAAAHRRETSGGKGTPSGDAAAPVDTGRFLREAQAHQGPDPATNGSTSRPIVTQLAEGYVVVEQRVGRAAAEWMLHIRCECQYHWFEREALEVTRCPSCGRWVHLDIESTSR
jgi:hypothetical protein